MDKDFWRGKRFLPLLVTQFFGAFNDNLFKNTLMTFVAYKMAMNSQATGIYANIMAGVFILPYFLFSALAGLLADKYSRSKIARCLKISELLLMLAAAGVFALQNINLLIFILFLMGTQSTFFGPIKYALLPQLLKKEELVAGNAYVEATTYISIITGSVLGTLLPVSASLSLLTVCAVIGIIASWKIPETKGVRLELNINLNIYRQVKENLHLISSHPIVFRSIIGATWFWILGAFFLTELFPLCSKVFNTTPSVVTLFLILFSVGVGVGSVFCNHLLKGEVSVIYVPLSAIGLSICSFIIYLLSSHFVAPVQPLSLGQFLSESRGWFISLSLFAFAFMGGLYIVPLNTLMQTKAPKKQTASVIAGNNIVNAVGMVAISIFAVVLIALGFKITDLFLFVALMSAGVALYICKLLPDALIRSIFCTIFNLFFRVKVNGLQVSLLDGILVAAYLPRKITFAIDSDWGSKWYVRLFSGLVDFYPLNPTNPLAIRSLIEVLKQNKTVMIFPEGRISVTGSLMKVYEGSGLVALKAGAKMLPLRIDGAQYSKFSYLGNILKTRMFPQIKLSVLPACQIVLPEDLTMRERRHQTSLKMRDIMANMMYTTTDKDIPLFNAVLKAEKIYGKNHAIALDTARKTLTYGQFLLKTYVLGTAFKKAFKGQEKIGLLLPNSLAGVVSFFALQFGGKIPVMLNFSLGDKQFSSCLKTTGLQTIVTAHKFIEQGQLERLENDALAAGCQLIYLEDFAKQIGPITKLKGLKKYILRQDVQRSYNQTAVILFTSGSEGLPKAVLLSHKNIISNVLQLHLAVPFNAQDVILNALPMFHSFGLTVGTILPFLYGVKTYFYPSPLHYRIIPEVAYDIQTTAVLGTDTFLYGYGRMANAYDFFSVRFAIVGGEKLKDRTKELWFKKFGIRIFEGYGTTETSPVLSVNTPMFYKENSVGRLLPCIEYRLDPVVGVENGGRLSVKADNVMQGYFLADKPEVLQKADSWYDTGDIVVIDDDGFLHIQGRAKRFAKIGGEMVSLTAVEQLIDQLYPDAKQGVLAVQDEKKGERLVLMTSSQEANIKALQRHSHDSGWVAENLTIRKP